MSGSEISKTSGESILRFPSIPSVLHILQLIQIGSLNWSYKKSTNKIIHILRLKVVLNPGSLFYLE